MNTIFQYRCNEPECECRSDSRLKHFFVIRNAPTMFQARSWMMEMFPEAVWISDGCPTLADRYYYNDSGKDFYPFPIINQRGV